MEVCAEIFRILQSPYLVARFQKFCGVEGHKMTQRSKEESDIASNNCWKVDDQNNCSPCFQMHNAMAMEFRNGTAKTSTNSSTVKQRHVTSNKTETQFECQYSYKNGFINEIATPESDLPESEAADSNFMLSKSIIVTEKQQGNTELSHGKLTEDVTNILEPEHWTNTQYDYSIKYNFVYYVFRLASGVGNETFFTLFFPYVLWNLDSSIGRQMSMVWFYIMYVGQATKDLIKLPRPASPPVVRLEKRYEYEYGMPSTHAMIGAAFPFGMLTLMQWRYPGEFSFNWGCVIAVGWMLLVATSRLYMGMHTVMDVIAGLAYTAVVLPPLLPVLGFIEQFSVTAWYAPLVVVPTTVGMCICYPKLDRWSTTRGDTTVVMATSIGVLLGTWLDFQLGRYKDWTVGPPYKLNLLDWELFYMGVVRFVIGSVIIVATRVLLKPVVIRAVCMVARVDRTDIGALQQLKVELPYKYITYCTLAFFAIFVTGNLFSYLGIERPNYLNEIL